MAALSCNEFMKRIKAEFGEVEYKATKGDAVIKSAGWVDSKCAVEVTPLTPIVTKEKGIKP